MEFVLSCGLALRLSQPHLQPASPPSLLDAATAAPLVFAPPAAKQLDLSLAPSTQSSPPWVSPHRQLRRGIFVENPYNVTGVCNRSSCPLANSRYATIRDDNGVFYLYMKTIERAHMPKDLWERVKLPRNYEKALEVIDKHLMYWPKLLIHKVKQRLTKMTQMRIRMRKLALKTREKIMTAPRKEKKREARREEKAEKAALLEKSIEKELLERLQKGVYQQSDIYNYPLEEYNKVLDMEKLQPADEEDEEEPEVEYVEGYDELEEEDDIEDFGGFTIHDKSMMKPTNAAGSTDDEEAEAVDERKAKKKMALASKRLEKDALDSKSKKARVLVEVEREDADERQRAVGLIEPEHLNPTLIEDCHVDQILHSWIWWDCQKSSRLLDSWLSWPLGKCGYLRSGTSSYSRGIGTSSYSRGIAHVLGITCQGLEMHVCFSSSCPSNSTGCL
ncbi:Ribosomal L28e/Mak16 [Sesbania bispinosa]|nr:Ribosomal L28e/Mak16 [Sesbania bispinosa]